MIQWYVMILCWIIYTATCQFQMTLSNTESRFSISLLTCWWCNRVFRIKVFVSPFSLSLKMMDYGCKQWKEKGQRNRLLQHKFQVQGWYYSGNFAKLYWATLEFLIIIFYTLYIITNNNNAGFLFYFWSVTIHFSSEILVMHFFFCCAHFCYFLIL